MFQWLMKTLTKEHDTHLFLMMLLVVLNVLLIAQLRGSICILILRLLMRKKDQQISIPNDKRKYHNDVHVVMTNTIDQSSKSLTVFQLRGDTNNGQVATDLVVEDKNKQKT